MSWPSETLVLWGQHDPFPRNIKQCLLQKEHNRGLLRNLETISQLTKRTPCSLLIHIHIHVYVHVYMYSNIAYAHIYIFVNDETSDGYWINPLAFSSWWWYRGILIYWYTTTTSSFINFQYFPSTGVNTSMWPPNDGTICPPILLCELLLSDSPVAWNRTCHFGS